MATLTPQELQRGLGVMPRIRPRVALRAQVRPGASTRPRRDAEDQEEAVANDLSESLSFNEASA